MAYELAATNAPFWPPCWFWPIVQCPVGTYFSLEYAECESCWRGSYQDEEGQMECKSCPDGFSTPYLHSRSLAECKGNQFAVYMFILKSTHHSSRRLLIDGISKCVSVFVCVHTCMCLHISSAVPAWQLVINWVGDVRVLSSRGIPARFWLSGLSHLPSYHDHCQQRGYGCQWVWWWDVTTE